MIKKIIGLVFILLAVGYLIPLGLVLINMRHSTNEKLDYVIVLGAKVNGDVPSQTLQYRLDKAWEYHKKHSAAKIIVTGAKGLDEDRSEASVMKAYLIKKGIADNDILRDDASFTTFENLTNARKLIEQDEPTLKGVKVGVVTTDFHVFRSAFLCRRVFEQECLMISSPNAHGWAGWYSIIREPFAVYKSLLLDK